MQQVSSVRGRKNFYTFADGWIKNYVEIPEKRSVGNNGPS